MADEGIVNGLIRMVGKAVMSKEVLEYVIYMIHACSKKWGQSPAAVYQRLSAGNCINGYLVPHYEVLHTQGTDYVVGDIEEYIGLRGGTL